MARKGNGTPSMQDKHAAAVNGAGAAGARALRMALAAGNGREPARSATRTAQLAAMCREAAAHLAEAHSALFEGPEDSETALAHLDAALVCLKAVAAHGPAPRGLQVHAKPKSA